ncbi:hypothetical protein ACK2WG_16995 [Bacillus spizizenii]|uniref:hypothetical protein n=1 Tax=Bacillus spizizenii TaxID=96241 RepID=UPI003918559B
MNSVISQQDNLIEQRVTEKIYNEGIKGLQQDIESIKIGGRNYIPNSGKFADTRYWYGNGGSGLSVVEKDGVKCLTAVGAYRHEDIKLDNDTEYVYSAVILIDADVNFNNSTPLHYWIGEKNQAGGSGTVSGVELVGEKGVLKAGTWHKVVLKFKIVPTGDI